MKKWNLFFVFLISTVLMAACGAPQVANEPTKSDSDKLQVVTTYSILYDIVKNVGGDRVEIHSLAPIGSNPHEYDPLPADVQKTTDADAVFYNGLNLEAGNSWFDKLMTTAGKTGPDAPVFRLSEGVAAKHLTTKGKESEEDPHAWLDVRNGIKYAENAKNALIKVDPAHKETYEQNAKKYIEQLTALHEEAVKQYNQIPKEQRLLVTSEGAFKYFSEAYDFEAAYIWEINSENQGTPEQVTQVVDTIRAKKIPALFVETSIDPRSMEMVSNETGVPIVGKVFTDSLGKPGEDGDTYIKMMEWNIKTIYEGLTKK
ncbi:metal ABC transporter substrate-binding protein [Brevibacillus formosus]|uniref:Manganese ABC transporter substrate-binding protein n=1 Tax=Brevibacillus formosus TaxID=54913 RepID=A0A837KMZ7_9BACL|nr:metal ABC transporter substrate-binding protein [Brevibacillus formosus]KLH98422.1 manganese ABC transporter substrate-binding protein [Brevibacillus formosus]MED1960522.1 metal ABC transporter substrate-binding protein [Brevibacillus formosus]PSJ89336.1 metal ABC transporter substrate-binding protein [Brevibacillus formosus]GED61455.1 manganese-binding lipoprotein MntA [Brevibacillus formosus]